MIAGRVYPRVDAMIEMELAGVRVELPTNQPIVLLKERDGERYLPIWIGAAEAAAIALSLQGVVTPRPMTHDLLKNILDEISVQVSRVVVTELRDSTFYATIDPREIPEDEPIEVTLRRILEPIEAQILADPSQWYGAINAHRRVDVEAALAAVEL